MAGGNSIKLFQFNQKYCQKAGIHQIRHGLNTKNWIFVTCMTQFFVALLLFLLSGDRSIGEYGSACFTLISVFESVTNYFILTWQMEEFLKFIAICEEFIAKSESSAVEWKNFLLLFLTTNMIFCCNRRQQND